MHIVEVKKPKGVSSGFNNQHDSIWRSLSSPECPHEHIVVASVVLWCWWQLQIFIFFSSHLLHQSKPLIRSCTIVVSFLLCSIPSNLVCTFPVVSLLAVCLNVCWLWVWVSVCVSVLFRTWCWRFCPVYDVFCTWMKVVSACEVNIYTWARDFVSLTMMELLLVLGSAL